MNVTFNIFGNFREGDKLAYFKIFMSQMRAASYGAINPSRFFIFNENALTRGYAVQQARKRPSMGRFMIYLSLIKFLTSPIYQDNSRLSTKKSISDEFCVVWGHLGASGGIWGHLGASGGIWGHLGASGGIWGHLGASGGIWGHPGASGGIWAIRGP